MRPNKTRIQPNTQEAETGSGKQSSRLKKTLEQNPITTGVAFVAIVTLPLVAQAGWLGGIFAAVEPTKQAAAVSLSASDVPLLSAEQNPNPIGARGGADIVVDENVLVSTGPVGEDLIAEFQGNSGEIRVYTVREGDSISQIADMFGVTPNTIRWANDLGSKGIHPGDTLVILPIAGVRHVVKSGDTLSKIAAKYDGDTEEILSYNQLSSADEISVGDTLIIPGGAMQAAPVRSAATPVRVTGSIAASDFSHPAPGSVRTQGIHGYNAVDLAGGYGSTIRAAAAGEVIVSKNSGSWNGGYGNYIVVRHSNGTQTLYAHLSSNWVGVGAYVAQGEGIGAMGTSGRSTGTHLHFEVRGGRNPF